MSGFLPVDRVTLIENNGSQVLKTYSSVEKFDGRGPFECYVAVGLSPSGSKLISVPRLILHEFSKKSKYN